jgi:hypothetical protein
MRDRIEQILLNLTASLLWTLAWNYFKQLPGVALPYIYSFHFQLFELSVAKYSAYGSLQSFALCVAIASPIVSNRALLATSATPKVAWEAQLAYLLRYWLWISPIFISLTLIGAGFSYYFIEILVFQ